MTIRNSGAFIGGFALLVFGFSAAGCGSKVSEDAASESSRRPLFSERKPVEVARTPVSEDCKSIVNTAEGAGLVRAGPVSRDGAVILTDARWAKLDFNMQESIAKCVSHYIAGSQNHWVTKITFRNQAAGVTYGTMENTRYTLAQ